ncbi:hypothetical protein EJ06DRAFT_529475 [Trichodelitschia bisporula]|uniref:CAP-Gly domain-containing protein n=1 Tax=Trichodelitschia bisporula TaxID=703511 RepID=A0A6G1HZI1_9PEZI|nr:hypothetical protein EJ06DRAFT_529475 [Trichodelitschia bisporula]
MANEIYVGKRLSFFGDLCTVRYIGEVKGTKGQWLGVEWDDPSRGKHAGRAAGVKYFDCLSNHPTAASFVRPNRPVDKPRTFVEALRHKYASEAVPDDSAPELKISGTLYVNGPPPPASSIRISGKEVEEVGFEKIRKQLAEVQELRIVLLDGFLISRPVDERSRRAWNSSSPSSDKPTDISDVCPKIVELDVSRNLFEEWHEIASVCEQLPNLRRLWADGNRFKQIELTESETAYFTTVFSKIVDFSLENTLLSWSEIVEVCSLFPALHLLTISNNQLSNLTLETSMQSFPQSVNTINLELNDFTSLADLKPLCGLTSVQKLALKLNKISHVATSTSETPTFSQSITEVDLSHNEIGTWSFIDTLHHAFPGMTALRIAHNPLFQNLRTADGKPLNADDGYMLTVARLKNLKTLNYSAVTDKDRLNAESYYLSQIAQELSLALESEAADIAARHPRYAELCEEYGEPEIRRNAVHVDPSSLAARLIKLKFRLADTGVQHDKPSATHLYEIELPKRFSVYTVLGIIGKHFRFPPLSLRLILETGEWEVVNTFHDAVSENDMWDSDDSEDEERRNEVGWADKRIPREIELTAGTRGIGTWIDSSEASIRVETT